MATQVGPNDVIAAVSRYRQISIPDGYYLGTAKAESDFDVTNKTPEYDASGNFLRYSYGIFQVSDEEAANVGLTGEDCLQLDNCARVFVFLAERNYRQIVSQVSSPAPDIWVFLAMAHNAGVSTAVWAAQTYGAWGAFKSDRSWFNRYGGIVLKGLSEYPGIGSVVDGLGAFIVGPSLGTGPYLACVGLGAAFALWVSYVTSK